MPLIPQADAEFDAFQDNAYNKINGSLASYGLVAADMVPMTAARAAWAADYPASITAHSAQVVFRRGVRVGPRKGG